MRRMVRIVLLVGIIIGLSCPQVQAWKTAHLKGFYICSGSGQEEQGSQFIWTGILTLDGKGMVSLFHFYTLDDGSSEWKGETAGTYEVWQATIGRVNFKMDDLSLTMEGILVQSGKGIQVGVIQRAASFYYFSASCWRQK